jgi:hypothetical protein
MRASDEPEAAHHATYLLTVWREGGGATWRAALRSAEGGDRLGFADLEQLAAFLLRLPERRTPPVAPESLGPAATKALIRRFVEEGVNQGRLEVIDDLLALTELARDQATAGLALKEVLRTYRAVSDAHWTIEEQVVEGDRW